MIARGVLKLLVFSKRIDLVLSWDGSRREKDGWIDSYDVDGLEPERSHPITVDATRGDGNLILIQFNQLVVMQIWSVKLKTDFVFRKQTQNKAVNKQYDR